MADPTVPFNWIEFATNFGPSALFVVMLIRMISKDLRTVIAVVNKMLSMTTTIRDDIRAIAKEVRAFKED